MDRTVVEIKTKVDGHATDIEVLQKVVQDSGLGSRAGMRAIRN